MKIDRKPPRVSSISGSFQPDRITQAELQELSDSQAAEWLAAKKTQKIALLIEDRLNNGAEIEDGPWEFDRELGMTRSTKPVNAKTG